MARIYITIDTHAKIFWRGVKSDPSGSTPSMTLMMTLVAIKLGSFIKQIMIVYYETSSVV